MTEQKPYESAMKWTIYGMGVAALLFIFAAIYSITRIVDGKWLSWQLPAILGILFIVAVTISAMFTSISDIKGEIAKETQRVKEKTAKETEAKKVK